MTMKSIIKDALEAFANSCAAKYPARVLLCTFG